MNPSRFPRPSPVQPTEDRITHPFQRREAPRLFDTHSGPSKIPADATWPAHPDNAGSKAQGTFGKASPEGKAAAFCWLSRPLSLTSKTRLRPGTAGEGKAQARVGPVRPVQASVGWQELGPSTAFPSGPVAPGVILTLESGLSADTRVPTAPAGLDGRICHRGPLMKLFINTKQTQQNTPQAPNQEQLWAAAAKPSALSARGPAETLANCVIDFAKSQRSCPGGHVTCP